MEQRQVAFIGWRGMVGSVLMERMRFEDDFRDISPVFFSTSDAGGTPPPEAGSGRLQDAFDLKTLADFPIVVSCQGGDYTKRVYDELRKGGWSGYWIDAASALRMRDDAVIVLDPVNRPVIDRALEQGIKSYIGGNCTVSLMLMAFGGLFRNDAVEWVSTMTYQAASGAGAKNMIELISQMRALGDSTSSSAAAPGGSAVELERVILSQQKGHGLPVAEFGVPLAGSLIPWIDSALESGQTREEWKGGAEANKILGTKRPIPVDGVCVRVGVLRCHSQAVTVKLKRDIPLAEVEQMIASGNDWVQVVPNTKEATLAALTPVAVSGQLHIPVGRIRKLMLGGEYLTAFTVGDQLLWGAAEPIRRMLRIILNRS